jgi:hypothetical protein
MWWRREFWTPLFSDATKKPVESTIRYLKTKFFRDAAKRFLDEAQREEASSASTDPCKGVHDPV